MKLVLAIVIVAIAVATADDNHYDTKYDNFDIEELLASDRLLEAYALCFIGKGKCTPEGNEIKKWIPEGTLSGCAKCTSKQKVLVAKFINAIQKRFPKHWEELSDQVDPERKYVEDLKKFLKEHLS